MSLMKPERMPVDREGRTVKLEVRDRIDGQLQEGYITANIDDKGDFKELFLQGFGKDGSTLYGWTQTVAILFSLGLQAGMDLEDVALKLAHQSFPPNGTTNDPDIPWCASVPDYIVRKLALWFGSDELNAKLRQIYREMES